MTKVSSAVYRGMRLHDLAGKSYARFWNPVIDPLRDDVSALLEQGYQAPQGAIELANATDLLTIGIKPERFFETGYARLKSGTVYVAVSTPMPEVTGRMLLWWFGWHGEESQRYKLWHPRDHLSVNTHPKSDGSTSMDPYARHLGIVSHVKEYVGEELQRLAIAFAPPSAFGLTEKAMAAAGIEAAICARIGYSFAPTIAFGTLMHLLQKLPTGETVMRSRFWLGDVTIGPGVHAGGFRPTLASAFTKRLFINEKRARALLVHCAEEMRHLASFLPAIYQSERPENT